MIKKQEHTNKESFMLYNVILLSTLAFVFGLTGCGRKARFSPAPGPLTCTTTPHPLGSLISCPDGSQSLLYNGEDAFLEVIDPCGDEAGFEDEILLRMADGQLVAWYKNVGFVLVGAGAYRTTDHQKCDFTVAPGPGYEITY